MHLCAHCWKLSLAPMSPFYSIVDVITPSNYPSVVNFISCSHDPPTYPHPSSRSSISHLVTHFLVLFSVQHKCCSDVGQQSLREDTQNDKAIKAERAIQKWRGEKYREDALPSYQIFVSPLFSPHLVKMSHSGRFMEPIKVKDWALHTASEVHFILIFNSCSFHIGDLPRRLSNNRFF